MLLNAPRPSCRQLLLPAALLLLLAVLPACSGRQFTAKDPVPQRLALKLRTVWPDSKATYFELDPDGTLAFGGGQLAQFSQAKAIGKITPEQKQQIWQIITTHRLFQAPNHSLGKGQRVTYDLTLAADGARHSSRSFDDEAPGLAKLQDLLFAIQADARYWKTAPNQQ